MKAVEKNSETDILARIQKLENGGEEALERKAKDILAMSIQRMANSVAIGYYVNGRLLFQTMR